MAGLHWRLGSGENFLEDPADHACLDAMAVTQVTFAFTRLGALCSSHHPVLLSICMVGQQSIQPMLHFYRAMIGMREGGSDQLEDPAYTAEHSLQISWNFRCPAFQRCSMSAHSPGPMPPFTARKVPNIRIYIQHAQPASAQQRLDVFDLFRWQSIHMRLPCLLGSVLQVYRLASST